MTPPLFAAVTVPGDIAQRLAALAGGVPGARWIPPENMHVTLRYLGELEDTLADDIRAGLAGIRDVPFDLEIRGVGHFGKSGDVRQLFADVRPHQPLERLRSRIEALARQLGVAPDNRRYRPHVTLARLKGAPVDRIGRFLETNGLLASPPFRVAAFVLFRSIRRHDGAFYQELGRYPLRP